MTERVATSLPLEPWELDALAAICSGAKVEPGQPSWVAQRVLDLQTRNKLGKPN